MVDMFGQKSVKPVIQLIEVGGRQVLSPARRAQGRTMARRRGIII